MRRKTAETTATQASASPSSRLLYLTTLPSKTQRRFVQMLRGFGALGRLSVAAVTRLEVHAGMSPEETYATQKLLSRFVTYDMDRDIADRAGDFVRANSRRGSVLSVPDAIIAVTAIGHGLALVTLNRGDFAGIPGLSLADIPETE